MFACLHYLIARNTVGALFSSDPGKENIVFLPVFIYHKYVCEVLIQLRL